MEDQNILYKNQFGFRKGHNTSHAIIALTEEIRAALDNNEFSVGIFVDLQKAFDTVDHKILLEKLNQYGVRGVANKVFESYLSNRQHCVNIRGESLNHIALQHGVPQGSILGPLLFLVYINDLNCAIKNSTTFHFADDTCLVYKNPSLKQLNRKVNQDLVMLAHWLRANRISLNTKKLK